MQNNKKPKRSTLVDGILVGLEKRKNSITLAEALILCNIDIKSLRSKKELTGEPCNIEKQKELTGEPCNIEKQKELTGEPCNIEKQKELTGEPCNIEKRE